MDTKEKTRSGAKRRRRPTQTSRATGTGSRAAGTASRTRSRTAPKPSAPAEKRRPQSRTAPAGTRRTRPAAAAAARQSANAQRSAQRARQQRDRQRRQRNVPKVVYTQPTPLSANKLLLQLATVMAVVLAITMGLSVFFKVQTVTVYGNDIYSAWTIREASGIEEGENLMTISGPRISGKIQAKLPYVKNVRVGINLPDTVNIYIEELEVVYAIQDEHSAWWLMSSAGKVVEQTDGGTAGNYTKILGVTLSEPKVGEMAVATEVMVAVPTDETEATDETDLLPQSTAVPVTGADRLNAALTIITALETNDIVGEAASVDVTSLTDIQLWYGQRYQVKLGDTGNMDKKITWMKQAIAQMSEYEMGVLDVSFVYWQDKAGYTPFE